MPTVHLDSRDRPASTARPRAWPRRFDARAALALAACGGDAATAAKEPTAIWAGEVRVTVDAAGLRVRNNTTASIAYMALDAVAATYRDWAPCTTSPSARPSLVPGGPDVVPFARLVGYSAATKDAIFYWWHLVPGRDGAMTIDGVRTVRVQVRG